jgi:hypothetical protein
MWPFKRKSKKVESKILHVYRFRPQEDMTARELAMLLTLANPLLSTVLEPEAKFDGDEPPDLFFMRELGMPELGRHFEPTFNLVDRP